MDTPDYNSTSYKLATKLVVKHYLRESFRQWKFTVPSIVLPAAGSILIAYIPPLVLSKVVERFSGSGDLTVTDFVPYVLLFGGSWLLGEIFWRIGIQAASNTESRVVETLYNDGLEQLLRRDLSFFHDNFAGSLTKRTLSYASRYIDTADTIMFNVAPNVLPAFFALFVLSFYSGWIALCLAAWIILTIIIIVPLIRRRRILVSKRETAHTVVSGHIADVYGNIDAVRAHANEKLEAVRQRHFVRDYVKKTKASWDYQNKRIDIIISPLYVAANVSGLLLSTYLALDGVISASSLIVVYAYYATVTRFMWEFNGIYRRLESSISEAAQYTELLLTEPTIFNPEHPLTVAEPKGAIRFEDIHFQYDENSSKLFADFSLDIEPGEKIGLVGRSGGGKTSITKLLLRFSDIDRGAIRIDCIDIKQLTQQELRRLIAYVPQEPVMFHRSLHENIAYGKQDATREEVMDAAIKAHAHDFIKDLPDGYETLVGERGIKLSGGQRQRVAIARAILKDAPILLLDEATSALDSESEKLIQEALRKLMEGKTAIVIAHRLSTIQKMDRIIVLDNGEIIEEGSHQKLVREKGVYAELWNHQSGGFLDE